MTYQLPDRLDALRAWLASRQVDVSALKTERQAAFFAQKLAGTRFKFPAKGKSCAVVLDSIQAHVLAGKVSDDQATVRPDRKVAPASTVRSRRTVASKSSCPTPADISYGLVIFCDGACEPNPGLGGWGFVVYRDGVEIHAEHGGERVSTNNIMEMTGALMALRWFADRAVVEPVRILCDSQYVVKGCNDWRHGWKAKGWKRGPNAVLANADLWRELDDALMAVPITLEWVKGHAGTLGNERADELAEMGRQQVISTDPMLDAPAGLIAQQLAYSV